MAQSYFKQNKRTPRIQHSEELYSSGMFFTNTPLSEGYQKLLVNFDFQDGGQSLKPRAALIAKELGKTPANQSPLLYNTKMVICAGADCVEENNTKYKQVITGAPTATARPGTKLYTGKAYVHTLDEQSKVEDAKLTYYDMDYSELGNVYYTKPEKAEIHKMPVKDLTYIARQVGTFAFNNNYYFFNSSNQLSYTKLNGAGYYVPMTVDVQDITPKEAVTWGYNMLQPNPYTFEDGEFPTLQLLGLLPYNKSGEIVTTPLKNTEYTFRCFYQAPKTAVYQVVWEWREVTTQDWQPISKAETVMTTLPNIGIKFSSPSDKIMIRVSFYKKLEDGKFDTMVEKVLTVGFDFTKNPLANANPTVYDLSTATGMTYWKNRLVVYGTSKNPTVLFTSDVNNPGYFPYPHGVETFDEPIVHAVPFLDTLLVFTTTKLHQLTLTEDGMGWLKKTIQGNLYLHDWDVHLIQVVKNMVFFKSGNYFYMVVPKSGSLTGELTIAPISKNIETFIDKFKDNILEVVDLLYYYTTGLELIHYYNFLDFDDVHNIYVFETDKGVYLNVDLLYNTILRAWRIHFYETQEILEPYRQDVTKKGTLCSLALLQQRWKNDTIKTGETVGIQFYYFDEKSAKDIFVPAHTKFYDAIDQLPKDYEDIKVGYDSVHFFKNYQLLDTGYREHTSDLNKRYRELQVKFNNISQERLTFLTEFLLDGDKRKAFYQYEVKQITDINSPEYGTIFLERIPTDYQQVPGSTVLAEVPEDTRAWTLDESAFPESVIHKIRIPISGKGYSPRFRMMSFNEELFELLNILWVFRTMYSR